MRLSNLWILLALAVDAAPTGPGASYGCRETSRCEYDYIIVGAGASGLTVASRLSEQANTSVLVIEAGIFDKKEDFFTIPGLAGGAIGTGYDWNLTYAKSVSLNGRNVSIPQGKMVGGSTQLNRMVFDRGSKSDYDRWSALGNKGWDWKSLLPYFKKTEIFTPPTVEIVAEYNVTYDPKFHGSTGNVHSTYAPFFWPTTKNLINATRELGIETSYDQASGFALGGYFCPHNQSPADQTRSSAKEAYYDTAKTRSNLEIITGHRVTRILTSDKSGGLAATGVEFASANNATRQTVSAKKEVILAAGSLHSPQLLQVSGIGDPKVHTKIGVATVVDLPAVGQNLQDHVLLTVVNSLKNAPFLVSSQLTSNTTFAAEARAEYDDSRTGPLTSPTGDFLAFLPLSTVTNSSAQLHASARNQSSAAYLPSGTPKEVEKGYSHQMKILNNKLLSDESAILEIIWADGAVVLGLQQPFSRGSIETVSANVFDGVNADAGFLRNPLDVAVLTEGVRFARKLAATSAIQELEPTEILPGRNVTSDQDLDTFIRSTAGTLYHPAGSCKLGARESGGVVDQSLRVYGIQGLRVVDASVIPMLPAGHLMTTVYAIAEKAADMIKSGVVGG